MKRLALAGLALMAAAAVLGSLAIRWHQFWLLPADVFTFTTGAILMARAGSGG